jgi:hypothetical protein
VGRHYQNKKIFHFLFEDKAQRFHVVPKHRDREQEGDLVGHQKIE